VLVLIGAGSAQALTLETVGDFEQPIHVTSDPGDADRLLVAERQGTIELVEGGTVTEFADLTALVECGGACGGERGLMSIAVSPTFGSDGRVFAFYANDVSGTLVLAELVSTDAGHDEASFDRNVLTIPHSQDDNHNGGQLQFGPEGDLYVSTGDGGGANGQFQHAQDPNDPLGKILRVDPDTLIGAYDVWSLGLRNPYRFSFDRATSDMVIGDVGQAAREEIDFAPSPLSGLIAGGENNNYGWNCREGLLPGPAAEPECALLPPSAFVEPVFDYPQTPDPDLGGERCAVIGGYVVRDTGLDALYGNYVYSDSCSGVIRSLRLPAIAGEPASGDCSLGLKIDSPVSFGEDAEGRIYLVDQGGPVYRLAGQPPAQCPSPLPPPQPPQAGPDPSPTFIGIKAQRRRVERSRTAVLTIWVSPCRDRRGDVVALHRNGRRNGSKFLSRACTARFLRRVHRNTVFTATTFADEAYEAGDSRRLRVKVIPRRR
jgi:Glucose / Sorbosone dehydrogenase